MKAIIRFPFFVVGFLAAPFVLAYCYPPSPSMKKILRDPLRWPMFIVLGAMFLVGMPFMWIALQLE